MVELKAFRFLQPVPQPRTRKNRVNNQKATICKTSMAEASPRCCQPWNPWYTQSMPMSKASAAEMKSLRRQRFRSWLTSLNKTKWLPVRLHRMQQHQASSIHLIQEAGCPPTPCADAEKRPPAQGCERLGEGRPATLLKTRRAGAPKLQCQ